MIFPPLLAYLVWIPVALYFFRRFPIRKAILLNFIGGWAVLPAARFAYSADPYPYWILGNSLHTDYFFTKATVTGITGLLGIWFFDRQIFRTFRLTLWDLPMIMWLVVPILSAIANPEFFAMGMRGELYQLLAWGVPYILGRLYFTDTTSLRLAATAFVVAGLFYVPICLVEIFTGPQFYAHLYGYEPYRWIGAARYIGYRPIGFLENGNQLGIWMATSALIAVWLWHRHTVRRILGIPTWAAALLLCAVTLACQSAGGIVLLICLLPLVFVNERYFPRVVALVLVFGILTFAGLRLANVVSVRQLVRQNHTAHSVAVFLKKIKKKSLGERLVRDEKTVDLALQLPILGSGEWDWWRHLGVRPWGLWLLAFGTYGILGLLALEALQLIAAVRVAWFPLAKADIEDLNLRHAFVATILMSAIDNLLNSAMILPLLIVIGGVSTWEAATKEVHIDISPVSNDNDYDPEFEPRILPPPHRHNPPVLDQPTTHRR